MPTPHLPEPLQRVVARMKNLVRGRRARHVPVELPPGAREELTRSNPRLRELQQRYRAFERTTPLRSVWNAAYIERDLELAYFRGDNAYLWQQRDGATTERYRATMQYVRSHDSLHVLERSVEDGAFGAETYTTDDGRMISRDLIDSALELDFLERELGLSTIPDLRILDIGAGYGRLAFHAVNTLPNLSLYACTDAVAESTFLCEYYTRYRQVDTVARTIPLDEIERYLKQQHFHVALNICSFSECPLGAIEWWLQRLAAACIPALFIVPVTGLDNGAALLSREHDRTTREFLPLLHAHGYTQQTSRPKYADADLMRDGIAPTHHHLFRR